MTTHTAPSPHVPQDPGLQTVIPKSGDTREPAIRIKRTIKYESDRVRGFGRELMRVPGCEQLESCIQCGTCSGVCPLSIYMDYAAPGHGPDPRRFQE